MTQMDEVGALVTSIGEYTVDTIGRERLKALSVSLDPRTRCGDILIALSDNTDVEQKDVIRDVFEVEDIFADEAVLTFRFVERPEQVSTDRRAVTPIYAYA